MKTIAKNETFQTVADKICVTVASLPAHLFFSADGKIWSQWEDNITERNVVISNIPVGTFLTFDSEVTITDK